MVVCFFNFLLVEVLYALTIFVNLDQMVQEFLLSGPAHIYLLITIRLSKILNLIDYVETSMII